MIELSEFEFLTYVWLNKIPIHVIGLRKQIGAVFFMYLLRDFVSI